MTTHFNMSVCHAIMGPKNFMKACHHSVLCAQHTNISLSIVAMIFYCYIHGAKKTFAAQPEGTKKKLESDKNLDEIAYSWFAEHIWDMCKRRETCQPQFTLYTWEKNKRIDARNLLSFSEEDGKTFIYIIA